MNISFIGLGLMGSRMASNILKGEHQITVYNRTRSAADELSKNGALVADSTVEAVSSSDIVFTMLSDPSVVEKVASGQNGFLQHMQKGALWADCSTVDPMFSRRMFEAASQHDVRFIDAPVAGTLPHAESAQLIFYVGGLAEDYQEVSPLLDLMGQKAMHMGPIGAGAAFKMLVNMMLAQSMLVFSEAVLLGRSMGIDEELMLEVLPKLPVIAPVTQFKTDMMRKHEYPVQFPLELMQKDLHLASLCSYEYNQPLLMTNLAKEIYANAKKAGYGREDFGAVYEHMLKSK